MSVFTILGWAATCAIGALLFLRVTADAVVQAERRLKRLERNQQRDHERRPAQRTAEQMAAERAA